MSLTSYRAAPSRAKSTSWFYGSACIASFREYSVSSRFGGYLLSHVLRRSTIGVEALNGQVRNGTGCIAFAMTTKPRRYRRRCIATSNQHRRALRDVHCPGRTLLVYAVLSRNLAVTGSNQAYRTISTGQLNALLHLHLRPIDVVVFHGPQGYLVLRGASRLDAFSGYPVRS